MIVDAWRVSGGEAPIHVIPRTRHCDSLTLDLSMMPGSLDVSSGELAETVIEELEAAVRSGSAALRVRKLREVSDLFLGDAARLTEEQVAVFDQVLCRLSERIEHRALTELSDRLAPVANAPLETIRSLAWHTEASVAGPVLSLSPRLTADELVQIARSRGQDNLAAISVRRDLDAAVTDVIVENGDDRVIRTLAGNNSAKFSETGMAVMVRRAERDNVLTELVATRGDLPLGLLRDLLARATAAVRDRILALFPEHRRDKVLEFLRAVTGQAIQSAGQSRFAAAEAVVRKLDHAGRLDEHAVSGMAKRADTDEVIAAPAMLSGAWIEVVSDLLTGPRNDAVLLPCKAAGLGWPVVELILRRCRQQTNEQIVALARGDYTRLTRETAQKTMRFLQVKALVN